MAERVGVSVISIMMAALLLSPMSAVAQTVLLQSEALDYDESRRVLTMAPLLDRVLPGVVSIDTVEREIDEYTFEGGIGSGVILDAKAGLIVTNHHVIDDANEITVTLSDRCKLGATLLGSDPDTDLALLRVAPTGLTALSLATDDTVRVGDFVIAIGNPFGLSSTVTSGIVSATGREGDARGSYSDFIQTDASINPGNSGGALLNSAGDLIGINASILSQSGSSSGIGFAVPSHVVRNVVERLRLHGEVRRGRIGVMIQPVPTEDQVALGLPDLSGAYLSDVTPGGAGAQAGLRARDVIVRFAGRDIDDSADLRHAVGLLEPGERAELSWYRGGALMSGSIRIFDAEPDAIAELPTAKS